MHFAMGFCSAFTLVMLILQNICDISTRHNNQWTRSRQPIQEVTKWSCGQSYDVRTELFLFYNGAFLDNPCIITIINNNRIPYARTCVKLDDIFFYDDSFECEESFRFYFGNYTTTNVTNFLSCSDIRQEVCDVTKTAYASFSSHKTFDKKFQIKVSTVKQYSKRTGDTGHSDVNTAVSNPYTSGIPRDESWDWLTTLTTTRKPLSSRRTWTSSRLAQWSRSKPWSSSWSSRSWSSSWSSSSWSSSWSSRSSSSSWSSWYSTYEKEKEEKKKKKAKAGIILLAVFGSVFGLVFVVLGCMFLRLHVQRTEQTNQNYTTVSGNQAVTSASQDEAGTSQQILGDDRSVPVVRYSAADEDHTSTNLTWDHATGNNLIPSAPSEESSSNGPGAPPPSYSSLFPPK